MEKKGKILTYIQDYRFNSILVKSFIIILIFFILTFTVVMAAVSNRMNNILTAEVGDMSQNALEKTRDRFDTVMEEVVSISANLALDEDVQKFMLPTTQDLYGRNVSRQVKNKIAMYSNVFNYIDSIYIYSHKNKYIVSEQDGDNIDGFEDINWVENLTVREYEPARMISRVKNNSYPNLTTYIQPIRLTQMQFLGGIIVNVDNDKLAELEVQNSKDIKENFFIIDSRENILYSSKSSFLRGKFNEVEVYDKIDFHKSDGYQIVEDENEKLILATASSNKFQWKYISTVPLSVYEEHQKSINTFRFFLYLLAIVLSIVASFAISIYCYQPVKSILDLLKNPDMYQEGMKENIDLKKNETHEITMNIVRNLYSNKQMKEEVQQYTNIIDKAQLTALQAQISPHFLYNTLENIRWRAMELSGGDNTVSKSILYLSEMLRNSLDIDEQIVTVKEEIRMTESYIKILQLRYEDKLRVIWKISEEVENAAIVKVSLQPLIENAVYHGIKPLRKEGVVEIEAYKENEFLQIYVKDNGVGMEVNEVVSLNEYLHHKYDLQERNIGIRNVNQRLKLLLGDDAVVAVTSKIGEGTKVSIKIPFIPIEEVV